MLKTCASIMLAAAVLGSTVPALAQDRVVFQANWLIQGENAYMFAGRARGFYREENIDLVINRGFGSGDTVNKVVAGQATVGTADIGAIMLGRVRQNIPVRCISAEYAYSPHSFWVLESSGIRSIADLVGKRVGITPGNSHLVYFPLVARANNVDPARVAFTNMEAGALLPTLLAGRIDAMPGFATVYELRNRQARQAGQALRMMTFADNGLRIYGECQFVAESAIAGNRDLLQRYMRATIRSFRWANENPEETARLHAAANPELPEADILVNHRAFMQYVFNETSARVGVGGFDMDQLRRTYEAVAAAQNLTAPFDPAALVDTQFLPQ
ncbi:MAG: ABC transporter substrate-binding protein [Alphaproteobacteria bacterium]|nr:ABC transporter substrate-binding protein [Alphaproteobacteria bacterium]